MPPTNVGRDGELIGIEVKSGRDKRTVGLGEFCKDFADANIIILDSDVGERLLSSQDPWDFIRDLP